MTTYDRRHPDLGVTRSQIGAAVRAERPRAYVLVDLGAPLVIAVLWMLLPFDATLTDRLIGLFALLLLAPLDVGLRRMADARWSNYVVLASRSLVVVVIPAFIPAVWVPAALGLGITTVGAIPVESRTRILSLVAFNSVGLAITGIIGSVDYWYLSVAVIVIISIFSDAFFREWSAEHSEIQRRHDELLDRAMMFSWAVERESGEIVSVVGNVDGVLGYQPGELIGQNVDVVVDADARRASFRSGHVGPDGEWQSIVRARHRDGRDVVLRDIRMESGADGVERGYSIEMTELARTSEALRYQAEHDGLTDLANRTVVERAVSDQLQQGDRDVAILLADLDRFKEINDTLGHPTGDRVLRVIAERLRCALDDVDVIARLGGDEFAFVVTGTDLVERAAALGEQIHELVSEPVEVDGLTLAVACSVGIAAAPDHGSAFADLMKHADIATYAAKRSGGGVRVFESTPDELSVQRLQLSAEVGGAVDRGELRLHFQPQIDLSTGAIVGAEGLARWHHPELGLLQPGAFLEAVEVAAAYHQFTDEVVRQAIEFASVASRHDRSLNVAVNLSSVSFLDRGLPGRISQLLDDYGTDPALLTLEVTESDLLDEQGADAPVFEALHELGVRLSIDDFGTGYSTLTRLRALSVDEVKIDRAFVSGVEVGDEDAIIVRSVIELCRLLGHGVVAEGVETPEQLAALQSFGCPTAQGFLFARPMPAAEMLELLDRGVTYDVGSARVQPASAG